MWVLFALLTSLLDASYYLCNQTVKLSPQLFILLRGYIPALLVFPFLPFFQAPEKPIFYLVCVGQGIFIAYHDFAGFKAIRRFGAEIVSSILPLSTGMLFVFWLVAEPSMSVQYWMNKTQFLLITASVTGIIYSVYKYNHQPESSAALKYMWLMLFAAMSINVLNKVATANGDSSPMSIGIYYAFVSSLSVGILNTIIYLKSSERKRVYDLSMLRSPKVWGIYVLLLLSMISKNMAMNYSPNPTYVAALIYLSILWIVIGNHLLNKLKLAPVYPHTKWRYVLLLVISSIVLILVTSTNS